MCRSNVKWSPSPPQHLDDLRLSKGLSALIQARRDLKTASTELAAALAAYRSALVSAGAGCRAQPDLKARSIADGQDEQQGLADASVADPPIKPLEHAGPLLRAKGPSRPNSVGKH